MKTVILNKNSSFRSKLDYNTTRTNKFRTLSYEESSFIKIIVNYFSLKPFLADSITYYMLRLKHQKRELANGIGYECASLACMIYACNNAGIEMYHNICVDGFVNACFKEPDRKAMKIQIYGLYQNIEEIFRDNDPRISEKDAIKWASYN